MTTIREILKYIFSTLFIASIAIWLLGLFLNIPGDGRLPAQTLTATVLGYERYADDCSREPGENWECSSFANRTRPVGSWCPNTNPKSAIAQFVLWFGTVAELTTLGTLAFLVAPKAKNAG